MGNTLGLGRIDVTPRRLLEFALFGLRNGRVEPVIQILQDALDQMIEHEKTKPTPSGAS